jgi:DNA-binding LacI/PurR family transcriptional regulator
MGLGDRGAQRRVTLQTLADELGVSHTSVANAFKRPSQLSPQLRERILAAAERHGYAGPDPAARALRSGTARVLGVVLTESVDYTLSDPYALEVLRGLATAAEQDGYSVQLISSPPGAEIGVGVRDAVVDGLCVYTLSDDHPLLASVLARRLPTVFIDGPKRDDAGFVGIDAGAATSHLVTHLLELGHMDVGILSFRLAHDDRMGPVDEHRLRAATYRSSADRIEAALARLRRAGHRPAWIHEIGINLRAGARQHAVTLLADPDRPSAVLCLSDEIALGVLDAAAELGIDVPDELSVTGFDDQPAAAVARLTTVRQPALRKGWTAWRLLRDGRDDHLLLDYEVVIRGTTGPPPRLHR